MTRWMKGVGEAVERDEPLFEVSTDKVDSEVPSPASGVLTEILVPEGETVEVGVKLAVIGDGATAGSPAAAPVAEAPAPPAPASDAQAAPAAPPPPPAAPPVQAPPPAPPTRSGSGPRTGHVAPNCLGACRRGTVGRGGSGGHVAHGAPPALGERDRPLRGDRHRAWRSHNPRRRLEGGRRPAIQRRAGRGPPARPPATPLDLDTLGTGTCRRAAVRVTRRGRPTGPLLEHASAHRGAHGALQGDLAPRVHRQGSRLRGGRAGAGSVGGPLRAPKRASR